MTSEFLGKTLLAFDLLHSVLKAKFSCYFLCFLTSIFAVLSLIMKRTYFLGVSSRSSCRSS